MARRLMTVPGIGPLIATAIATLAPPPQTFRKVRDFAAWLGLTARQHSTGGKQRLGATTTLSGHSAATPCRAVDGRDAVTQATNVGADGAREHLSLYMQACVAGQRMARIVWALMVKGGVYQSPVTPTQARCRSRGRRSGRGHGAVWRNSRKTGSGEPVCMYGCPRWCK